MHILALETSGTSGSVAVLDGGNVLAEVRLDPVQRSARSLAPAIKRLIEQVAWRPADVELVAIAIGPGSFTGLRVGVTTAKTFAYAVGAEVVAVNTLEVIAAQTATEIHGELIAAAIDAQRDDVYAATFRSRSPFNLEIVAPLTIRRADQWIAGLAAGTVATGPALEKLLPQWPPDVAVASRDRWFPLATTVGRLAAVKHSAGQRHDVWRLAPLYLRASAAEDAMIQKASSSNH